MDSQEIFGSLKENKTTITRSGRLSTSKRKLIEELNDVEVSIGPKKTKVKKFEAKKVSTRNSLNKNNIDKVNQLEVGDIVLGKTGKFPLWPGIVTSDPDSDKIIKSK